MRTLRTGETIRGRDGAELGEISRLVLDDQARRITHVVVGDRLIGLQRLSENPDGDLVADVSAPDLDRMPPVHDEFVGAPDESWTPPQGYRRDQFVRVVNSLFGQAPYVPPVSVDLDLGAEHEISPRSPVWSGTTRLGEVDEVVTGDDGAIRSIVLRRGWPKPKVSIPIERVTEVVGTNVHVDLDEAAVEALPHAD